MQDFDAQKFAKQITQYMNNRGSGGSGGRASKGFGLLASGLALMGIAGFSLYNSVFVVEGGFKAIKFNRFTGVGDRVYGEGYHLLIPGIERPIIYDQRATPKVISSNTGSKDLQTVNLSIRVLFKPDVNRLDQIYRSLGMNYSDRVMPSIVTEVLKSVVAQFTAAELLTKRPDVSARIRDSLVARARDFNIIIDDVAITHLRFGDEYSAAVERKQVAQQEAERAKFIVEKAKEEKKSMVLKAEGESEAIRLVGDATKNNTAFLDLRKIEAAQQIADTISQSQNRIFLSSDTLLLNLQSLAQTTNIDK
ncbi:prohibitin [Naegleria gruberi]|uniref:Prohibitin n=1 Tax=Naegleria gruberi TaxID=5762 RepID=D2W2C5_NAEGR|nr:prohibitin [Naegleria gruberi]EFC36802.1 prohibitin [Naegleria gruberi]|eukprot:XP_002669546.1 prohibitin [Naegleria gruberi]